MLREPAPMMAGIPKWGENEAASGVQSGCHILWGEPSPFFFNGSIVKSFTMCQFLASFGIF